MQQSRKFVTSSSSQIHKSQLKPQVYTIFQKLNKQIDVMDVKVQLLLQKHEGQFVLAYQNHIRKIKADLQALRQRADQQQRQLKDNNRAVYLQKQAALFRQQSLKLYERLQVKTQQAEYYKYRTKDLQKTALIMQKQVRQALKSKKVVEVKLTNAQNQLKNVQNQLNIKTQQILNLTQQITQKNLPLIAIPKSKKSRQQTYHSNNNNNNNLSLKMKQSTKLTSQSKASLYQIKQKSLSSITYQQDSELRQWFLQCVKAVKKQIATRKGQLQPILQNVKNIDQFMLVDKLRVLEKFVESQKLLVLIYEKIFPSRLNQVRQYLSHRKISLPQNQQIQQQQLNTDNKSTILSKANQKRQSINIPSNLQIMIKNRQERLENSVQTQRGKVNYHIGNRVSFKQGRLKYVNPNSNLDSKI